MVTISRTVEKIIEDSPFVQEALSKGIINYVALAEDIKPRVDIELKSDVKVSAIMMSLRRLKERLEKKFSHKSKFTSESDIVLKSDLFEVTLRKSDNTFSLIQKIYSLIDHEKDFLTITQGIYQITIIANNRNQKRILQILEKEDILSVLKNLSCMSTILPMNSINESGYFYTITRAFAWEDIPIIEMVSTLTELNVIIRERDVPKAFLVFKSVIKNNE